MNSARERDFVRDHASVADMLGGPWPTWPTLLSRPCDSRVVS